MTSYPPLIYLLLLQTWTQAAKYGIILFALVSCVALPKERIHSTIGCTIIIYKERYLVNTAKLIEQETKYKELNNEFVKCRTHRNWLFKIILFFLAFALAKWVIKKMTNIL